MNGTRLPFHQRLNFLVRYIKTYCLHLEWYNNSGYFRIADFIWLHIRGAGGWTNNLYDYFEKQKAKICIKHSTGKTECQHCCEILSGPKANRLVAKTSAGLHPPGLKLETNIFNVILYNRFLSIFQI